MGHWREVVAEQAAYMAKKRFSGKVVIGFIGGPWQDLFVRKLMDMHSLNYEIGFLGNDLRRYEYPTLVLLWEYAKLHPGENVGYLHSKGVSRPNVWHSMLWRWAMTTEIVGFATSGKMVGPMEIAGYAWTSSNEMSRQHFRGNFWITGTDYAATLEDPDRYKDQTAHLHGWPNPERFPAEAWIGSGSFSAVKDLCSVPGWQGEEMFPHKHEFWVDRPGHEEHYMRQIHSANPVELEWDDGKSFVPLSAPVVGAFDFPDVYRMIVDNAPKGATIVEVGVYAGKSLAYLAEYASFRGRVLDIVGIDRFDNCASSPDDGPLPYVDHMAEVGHMLDKYCQPNIPRLIRCDSDKAAELFRNGSVFAIWLDADHSREAVANDIRAWLPKLAENGVIGGHDYDQQRVRDGIADAGILAIPCGVRSWLMDSPQARQLLA